MAAPQARGQLHRERGRVAPDEVVDVIVLAGGKLLPLARPAAIDVAVDLQQDRSLVERKTGVGVRLPHRDNLAVGSEMPGTCHGRAPAA